MRLTNKSLLETKWVQEVSIFFILFILITLNAWHSIGSFADLAKAVTYFFILYVHVQLHRFVFLPRLLNKGRHVAYFICTALSILLFSGVLFISDIYWIYYWVQTVKINKVNIYFYHVGTCCLSLIAMLAPFLVLRFYVEQKKQALVQISMNQMELKSLSAQLNPHFLFNTFNNLYGISLSDPTRVPDIILQVSKLMRYQLDSNNREWVALDDELSFIEGYIELEEERVGQRCDIRYAYENNSTDQPLYLTPLLLISFIENAFKHGTNSITASYVYINIGVKNAMLHMQIINSIPYTKNPGNHSMGIGIKNTIQRLNILYPGKYKLAIGPGAEKYTVDLTLPLTADIHVKQD